PENTAPKSYPRTVLLIRHAEKLVGGKSVHLNEKGVERAKILAKLFEKSASRPTPFPTPDYIIAGKNTGNSHRPVETVTLDAQTPKRLRVASRRLRPCRQGVVHEPEVRRQNGPALLAAQQDPAPGREARRDHRTEGLGRRGLRPRLAVRLRRPGERDVLRSPP